MGLLDDAQRQAQDKAAAECAAVATQDAELSEFVSAMADLDIAPRDYMLYGWLSYKDLPTSSVPTGISVSGWAITTYSASLVRYSNSAPFTTFHTVVTTDHEVFETADQHVYTTGLFIPKVVANLRPLRTPIKDVVASAQKRIPLSQALRDTLAAALASQKS